MSAIHNYYFNNQDRIGSEPIDNTQRTITNTKFANYTLANYQSDQRMDNHVQFATQQPTLMFSGTAHGRGIGGSVIDTDSALLIKSVEERPLEKLQLLQRPFATVPYIGRGSCDPTIESQLQQGEITTDRRSVSANSETSFTGYTLFTSDNEMVKRVQDHKATEAYALNGWTWGGASGRESFVRKDVKKQ